MTNWPTKKLGEILIIVILIGVILMPFIYVVFLWPERSFWDNTMGNMLATVLALIAGVPIAFWIDRLAQSRQEHQKYHTDRKREKELLQLIKEELYFSHNSLFLKGKRGNKASVTIQPLKSDLWDSLISSEETKYIEEPSLLNRIASAYYVLKIVKNIEEQAYIALRTSAIRFTLPDGTRKNAAQLLLEDARTFDHLFENSIQEALKMIDKRLKKLKLYEN